jgi:hypothetical protein
LIDNGHSHNCRKLHFELRAVFHVVANDLLRAGLVRNEAAISFHWSTPQRMTALRSWFRIVLGAEIELDHSLVIVANGPVLPFKRYCDAAARPVEPAIRASRSIFNWPITALRDKAAVRRGAAPTDRLNVGNSD